MVNTAELENYLSEKSAQEGDIVEITGEGSIQEFTDDKGKVKKMLNVPVLLNGQLKLTYSPAKNARYDLEKAFGKDTLKWTGKKFQVKFVIIQIGNQERNVIKPIPIKE